MSIKSKLLHFLSILVVLTNVCSAQNYFGNKKFGRVEMLNDSTCTLCFIFNPNLISTPGGIITDTCSIIKSGDTIYISTKVKKRVEPVYDRSCESCGSCTSDSSDKVPINFARYIHTRDDKYFLYDEMGCYSCEDLIDFSVWHFNTGDIVVVQFFLLHIRFKWIYGEATNVVKPTLHDGCCLDNFPLLVKGNKLIPIDKRKNEQCWIDNGFYFPTMKKSNKEKEFECISLYTIGLRGLPNGYYSREKKYCKHRPNISNLTSHNTKFKHHTKRILLR